MDITFTDRKQTPLHLACKHGLGPVVRALVVRGAPLNPIDAEGHTPLHYTREHDNSTPPIVIEFLMGEGCLYYVSQEKIGQKRARSPEVNADPEANRLLADNPRSALNALWEALSETTYDEEARDVSV